MYWKYRVIYQNCLEFLFKPSFILGTEKLKLTFLKYCSFADLLCSHCKLRLLLAGWYDGLEVIVSFLKFWNKDSLVLKKRHFFQNDMRCTRIWKLYLDGIPPLLLSLGVRLSSAVFIRVFIWCLMSVVTVFIIYLQYIWHHLFRMYILRTLLALNCGKYDLTNKKHTIS